MDKTGNCDCLLKKKLRCLPPVLACAYTASCEHQFGTQRLISATRTGNCSLTVLIGTLLAGGGAFLLF